MGYCTVADVQALRPQISISANSKPSTADVQVVIEQISDHINAIMSGQNILVPLTQGASPIAYGYVRACVMWGVAGKLEDAQRAAVAGARAGSQEVENDYYSQYTDCIKAITVEPGILSDAPQGSDLAAQRSISSFFTHNPTDDQEQGMRPKMRGTTAEPRFRIEQDF